MKTALLVQQDMSGLLRTVDTTQLCFPSYNLKHLQLYNIYFIIILLYIYFYILTIIAKWVK